MTIVNFIIAILSILSIGVISITFFIDIDPELYQLLEYFDILLCLFFFGDFMKQLAKAENKWRYFYTYGWIDLLSSIPVVNEFRYARILRVFRVLRLVKSLKLLTDFFKKKQTRNSLWHCFVVNDFINFYMHLLCAIPRKGYRKYSNR